MGSLARQAAARRAAIARIGVRFGGSIAEAQAERLRRRVDGRDGDPEVSALAAQLAAAGSKGACFSVIVCNTGRVHAAKVVQLYVARRSQDGHDEPTPPRRSLAALTKVALDPGQTTRVDVKLKVAPGACPLCVVTLTGTRLVRSGMWKVSVGNGASDELSARSLNIVGPDVVVP